MKFEEPDQKFQYWEDARTTEEFKNLNLVDTLIRYEGTMMSEESSYYLLISSNSNNISSQMLWRAIPIVVPVAKWVLWFIAVRSIQVFKKTIVFANVDCLPGLYDISQ